MIKYKICQLWISCLIIILCGCGGLKLSSKQPLSDHTTNQSDQIKPIDNDFGFIQAQNEVKLKTNQSVPSNQTMGQTQHSDQEQHLLQSHDNTFQVQNNGAVLVESKDNIKVYVSNSPIQIVIHVSANGLQNVLSSFNASTLKQKSIQIIQSVIQSLIENGKLQSNQNTLSTIVPQAIQMASMDQGQSNSGNQSNRLSCAPSNLNKGLSISNPGEVSVSSKDDVQVSVSDSPIAITIILGDSKSIRLSNDFTATKMVPPANQEFDMKTNQAYLQSAQSNQASINQSLVQNKDQLLENGQMLIETLHQIKDTKQTSSFSLDQKLSCLYSGLLLPIRIFKGIQSLYKKDPPLTNNTITTQERGNISENPIPLKELLSLVPDQLLIENNGKINVQSKDKINVSVHNSPITIQIQAHP